MLFIAYDISSEKQKSNMDRQKYEREKQKIGTDPGIKKKEVKKTRTVSRTGLFAGFRDWFFGEKTETYYVKELDYSEQNEWKKRKATLEEQNRRIQDSHNQRMIVLEERKRRIQEEIRTTSKKIESFQKDILDLENRAKREQEIYERTLKANKQEYCDNEKRKLKQEFLRVLFYAKDTASVEEKINKHIDNIDLKYLPIIQDKVLKYYDDSIKSRIESMTDLIRCNETELEAKYEFSKKELAILDEVLKFI